MKIQKIQSPPFTKIILRALRLTGGALALMIGASLTQAATLTWDADSTTSGAQEGDGSWTAGSARFWNGTSNVSSSNNLTTDIARFGNGGNLDEPATVDVGTQSINGLLIAATTTSGYTLGSADSSVLTLGASGVVMSSGAQDSILGNENLTLALGINQTWTNSSTSALTFAGIVDGATQQLVLGGAGPVNFAGGFSNFGLNSTFDAGTNVSITADSVISTHLFANGNTTISAGTTSSASQYIVINNTGHLLVKEEGILTGVMLRIGSTSGQSANVTVAEGGQITAAAQVAFSHGGGTVLSYLNLDEGGTFTTPVGFHMTGVGGLKFNGGTLKLTDTLADLKASGGAALSLNVIGTAIIDVAPAVTVGISQVLAHSGTPATDGGLTKTGAGTLQLGAANTYTGDTTVEGGTLSLASAYLNNFSNVTVAAGAVLNLTHGVADSVASLTLDGVFKPDGTYNASNSGGLITGTGSIKVDSTPTSDDPMSLAFAALRSHIDGATTLTAAQLNSHASTIRSNAAKLGTNATIIAEALSLVTHYETTKGALFIAAPTRGGYTRAATGFELPNAMLALEQAILDRTYTAASLALHQNLLNGWKIGSSAYFPGSVAPPADPTTSRTVSINASQPKAFGVPVMYQDLDARRPTGSYLAPGSIATVTVPQALVGKNFKVRVGAHSWDLSAKTTIKRHDRVTRVYTITSTTTKIASPLGGGIYIEVPYLANQGIVNVQITNAVRSPFFSAVAHRPKTTNAEWATERGHPGPWADFESDKFMMQVPRSWIYNYADPVTVMTNWDKAMDAVSDLFGHPHVRSKTVMYVAPDVIYRVNVNAPGYPMSNDQYNPYATTNGNQGHYLLTGVQNSPWAILHELGHAQSFTKFSGEIESAVNLLYVAVLNQKFGKSLDAAYGASIGAPNNTSGVTMRNVSLMWILKNVFRTGNKTMVTADMSYEHKGYGKYVEIANLFGWQALGDFWHSVNLDYAKGITYLTNSDPTDSRIVRMSKAAKYDLRPLFHLWGAPPINATNVRNGINAAKLPPSGALYRRLKTYQTYVPTSQTAYNNFYWAIDGTGPDTEIKGMFTNKSYTTAIADSAKNAIQGIINLYFPDGDPDLIVAPGSTWDIAPGIAGAGDGNITTAAGNWNTTTANWTNDDGLNNVIWTNGSNATFGSGTYTVTLASGVTAGNLTISPGAGTVTLKAAADNGGLALGVNPLWTLNDNTLNITADSVNDTKLTLGSGDTLRVTGSGTFNTGEKPVGADWTVAGSSLSAEGTLTLRGNASGVGKFSSISMAAGTSYFHEKNSAETYVNAWDLSGGQALFDTRYPVTPTYSGVISGTGGITSNATAVLSGANTYTGTTFVSSGTLGLTGNRTGDAGNVSVGNATGNTTATVNIANGDYTVGTVTVGSGNATAAGFVNQTGGSLTLSGTQLILGNVGTGSSAGTASTGTYNLSGGTLRGSPSGSRGIIMGTNNGTTGIFNVSGTGNLALDDSILMVGRSDSPVTGSSGYFNQSGGTSAVGILTVAGGAGTGNIGHMNLTGGTFNASTFPSLATAPSGTASITIGGSANVTLPAFPTVRGSGSTATIHFDGGTLIPAAASTVYLGGLNNAFIKSGGATLDVPSGRNITVSQILRVDPASTGGGLTKLGSGLLTLTGANTYAGPTSVNSGTLSITQPYLANAADVTLSNGGVLNLNFSGTDTVDQLYIDGVLQAAGTWGSLGSAAANKTARLTGNGILNVANGTGAASAFESWASSSGLDGTPGKEAGFHDDPDNDGVANGLEWILGGNPLAGGGPLMQSSTTETHFSISFTRNDESEATASLAANWGGDLGSWNKVTIGAASSGPDANGVIVTVTENGTAPDSIMVAVPRSLGSTGSLFVRLSSSIP